MATPRGSTIIYWIEGLKLDYSWSLQSFWKKLQMYDIPSVWPGHHDIPAVSVLLLIYSGGENKVVITSRFPYPILLPPVPFCPFVSWLPPFSETDETLTWLTGSIHVYMCHATYDVSDLERFPVSPEVMLLFSSQGRIFVFWIFSHIKFCFKHRRTLNGSQGILLGSFLWLNDKQ